MDMNIDLNELLKEIKEMDENHPLKVKARQIVEEHENAPPETEEDIKVWAGDLAEKLSKLTD